MGTQQLDAKPSGIAGTRQSGAKPSDNESSGLALILAPLAGVTGTAFRTICRSQGAAMSYTEMVSAKGLYYRSPGSAELLQIAEDEGPAGIQLFGSEPEVMAWAVEQLAGSPCTEFNINMGCPVPKIYNNGEGSALLKSPDLAARIVEAMAEAAERTSGKPVTVKMRLVSPAEGYAAKQPGKTPAKSVKSGETADNEGVSRLMQAAPGEYRFDFDENGSVLPYDADKTVEFARKMAAAGAAKLIVHGRTREQYYSGHSDWDAIAEIKKAVSIPVIGNGDVRSIADAVRMRDETGCDGVMIGRGAMGNPWIFRRAFDSDGKPVPYVPTIDERKEMILRHMELLQKEKIPVRAILEMRKHFAWYTKGLPGASEIRKEVNTANTADEIINLVNKL